MSKSSNRVERVALVTGAGGGVGLACCKALGNMGLHVIATDLNGNAAAEVEKALRDDGVSASSAMLDVCDRDAVEAFVNASDGEVGDIDVVVNLAGVIRNNMLVNVTIEDFRLTMASHVEGSLNTMRVALPKMKQRGYGRVVNMSSTAARGALGGTSYNTAKGAIEALSRTAAIEFAEFGITVNCVASGPIDAGIFKTVPDKYRQKVIAGIPMRRPGRPEELANSIAFLASESASYITGQTLTVCGGASIGL